MRRFRAVFLPILLAGAGASALAERQARPAAAPPALLTVDSIMRGPGLVGWPPTRLRWDAGSRNLYFEWRKPGDEEAATYVVGRDGGDPRKLTEAEAIDAPPADGRWDRARRRLVSIVDGDVVVHDGVSGTRIQVTRTKEAESGARWARNDTHVTYVRDGNLFIVPLEAGGGALVSQLTDVAPKKAEPRLTDSQKFIRDEEQKLIDYLRQKKEEKGRIPPDPEALRRQPAERQSREDEQLT